MATLQLFIGSVSADYGFIQTRFFCFFPSYFRPSMEAPHTFTVPTSLPNFFYFLSQRRALYGTITCVLQLPSFQNFQTEKENKFKFPHKLQCQDMGEFWCLGNDAGSCSCELVNAHKNVHLSSPTQESTVSVYFLLNF